ncbi:hypothetical protein [Ruminococcus sp. YRD2003]
MTNYREILRLSCLGLNKAQMNSAIPSILPHARSSQSTVSAAQGRRRCS